MREHCAQCLKTVYANGRLTPAGNVFCAGCYSALWGPKATDSLRELVDRHTNGRRHTGHSHTNGRPVRIRAAVTPR